MHVSWGWVLFSAGVMKMQKMQSNHSEQVLITFPSMSTALSICAHHLVSFKHLLLKYLWIGNHDAQYIALFSLLATWMSDLNPFRPFSVLFNKSLVPVSSPLSSYRSQVVATKLSPCVSILIWISFYLQTDLLSSFPHRRCIVLLVGQTVIILVAKSLEEDTVSVR